MAGKSRIKKSLLLALKIGFAAGLLTWLALPKREIKPGHILQWPAFCAKLAEPDPKGPGIYARLRALLPAEALARVDAGAKPDASLTSEDKARVAAALGEVLAPRDLYRPEDFDGIRLGAEAKHLLQGERASLSDRQVRRLNRVLLEAAFPIAVAKSRMLDPYEILDAVRHHLLWMVLAFVLYNVCIVLTANRWRMLLMAQDIHPSRLDCIRMNYIGLFFSTFLPGATGGDFVKAYYVARGREKKAEAVTTVFLDRVFGLYCMIGYGTVAILFHFRHLWHYESEAGPGGLSQAQFLIVLVGGAFVAATVGLAAMLSSHCRRLVHVILGRLPMGGDVLKRVYEAVYLYGSRPGVLLRFVGFSVVAHSLGATSMLCVGVALGDPVATGGLSALNYYFLIPLGLVINGLPLTPAGLGAFEAAAAWLFKTVGSDMGANVAALGHVVFLLTNQIGLIFYVQGKKDVAAAAREAALDSDRDAERHAEAAETA